MHAMTDRAREYWKENPPNSPYTLPAVAISKDDGCGPESDVLSRKRTHAQINSDGYKFSASEYEFCSDYGSISMTSDVPHEEEKTEKFPDFVDSGSFSAMDDYPTTPNPGQQYHFPQHLPLQLAAGCPYNQSGNSEQNSNGHQVFYSLYSGVQYLPRYSTSAMEANHLPVLDQGLAQGQNGRLDGNFQEQRRQTTNHLTLGTMEVLACPLPVNPNAVGADHQVGIPHTIMRQKGGDVVSPVTLATSEEHTHLPPPAQTSQFPSDNNTQQQQSPTPSTTATAATAAGTTADWTMPVADKRTYGYIGNPACYLYTMPFDNGARYSLPPKFGVIKITNIPYAVTKHEILQFLGRNAKPLTPDLGCPVHIIMERSTGKTMDCYVEFPTKIEADSALAWVNRGLDSFQTPKLGNRHVLVRASNQDELLKDLFPRAKNVHWRDGIPHVKAGREKYCSGFQGFLTGEEIFCTVRHAEVPQRSVYCSKCLQRPYENMMSTLYKFPWYATCHYTVEDRNQLFSATLRLIHALVPQVERGQTIGLDSRLVQELLDAGLRCPVFNDRQKFVLNIAAKNYSVIASPTARFWPFDTITRKPNASEKHVMQYAELIVAGAATKDPGTKILANTWNPIMHAGSPFGKVWLEWGWGNTHHKWQTAVDYENSVLIHLVTEGVKHRQGAESCSNTLSSSTSSNSVLVEKLPAVPVPGTNRSSQSISRAAFRYPVRATHNLNRQATSAPVNLISDLPFANVLDYTGDTSSAGQAKRHVPSNSFSGFADARVMVSQNIFGAMGGQHRTSAATNGSRHSPVPEVDEDCYERAV
ncbi:hypothetical protein AJ78_04861 [Emergomyces pasteurianus Ep9510]|uniref:RRM domain-containing protein n=1 Tax=Emergomyces pasteurianus Ep9510 TaxID=1447872 RepID=A0A1J9QFB0_9EURO|nr:hypothetical protein AJ78_04861 [Emergomyces pasteurianus Ep9510]